jgi:hypothetical protein
METHLHFKDVVVAVGLKIHFAEAQCDPFLFQIVLQSTIFLAIALLFAARER